MEFIDELKYKDNSGIYGIRQISTNLIYIGQTKMKFKKRYWNHSWKLNNNIHDNIHLQNAWNKYGYNDFVFEIIHIIDKNENMNDLEIGYIKKYNSFKNGFNLTIGGEGKKGGITSEYTKKLIGEKNKLNGLGRKASEETRLKMKNSSQHKKMTPENSKKLKESRIGIKHTGDTKQKMKESHIGSKNHRSIINEDIALIIKNKLINNESISSISKELNVKYHIIKAVSNCKAWNHVLVENWDSYIKSHNESKPKYPSDEVVRQIRKLIQKSLTAKEISKIHNININVIYGIKQNRTYNNIK